MGGHLRKVFSEDLEKVLEERRENGTPKLRRKTAKAG
jgi:hypothetical protein